MCLLISRRIMKPTIRIKVKNGIEYWYEETYYYDKEEKQIQHRSKYLGRNVDGQPVRMRSAPDEVKDRTKKKTASIKSSFDYGSILVLQTIMEELNIDRYPSVLLLPFRGVHDPCTGIQPDHTTYDNEKCRFMVRRNISFPRISTDQSRQLASK
jgi:hypothetical protein